MRASWKRAAGASLFFLCAAFLGGCAADSPTAPASKAPAAPRYNLAGYSADFKQGYADACAAPRRRNDARFKAGGDYQIGWNDGSSICKK